MSLAPGTELPARIFGPITMTDIVAYQGASGDLNPMHYDDDLARSAGYPAAFSVGMLGAGYLAALCSEHLGEESVRRFRTRFRKVVQRGEVLTGTAVVTRLFEEEGEARAELTLALTNAHGDVVVDGDAEFVLTADGQAAL
ncbi:MaoC/PaaZ C-terminal domain-containing protein [Nocardioides panzhihuensis]|uniref:Acyl dehydratase n=1 Tax=Nocardioides panzhihuensis TaxID=860243 RepID=A0A7Z0DHS0_9ACTN|nr:MaoC/PaaZ C-terminal domain-containing protein [Nocardioides panzhihuensis]NYI75552.1 acyl dehydratase [Nocardioides panzhihuensis]